MSTCNYKFFQHTKCEYFPCHIVDNEKEEDNFNCLFCYCPLYQIKDCGGNHKYIGKSNIKDCSDCLIPHSIKGYEYVIDKLSEINNKTNERID